MRTIYKRWIVWGPFDAANVGWRFPVKNLRECSGAPKVEFAFTGLLVTMRILWKVRSFYLQILPRAITSEIGMLGAYGTAMRTEFNGFGNALEVIVLDEPMASLYNGKGKCLTPTMWLIFARVSFRLSKPTNLTVSLIDFLGV